MKKVLIRIRNWAKFFVLISVATFIIAGIVVFAFKPIYSVTLNGELIGYCSKKSKLQTKIDEYIEKGNGDNSNLAFVLLDCSNLVLILLSNDSYILTTTNSITIKIIILQ